MDLRVNDIYIYSHSDISDSIVRIHWSNDVPLLLNVSNLSAESLAMTVTLEGWASKGTSEATVP